MKIVIAPDSFKGSLTAGAVADGIAKAFQDVWAEAHRRDLELVQVPLADGGEGTVESLVAATGGRLERISVCGPRRTQVETVYGVLGDGETAVLEVANICGLPMLAEDERDPEQTTSYGLGEAVRAALNAGHRKFIIGLGGSACNDGGLGMLQALGAVFLDASGHPVEPSGRGVAAVAEVRLNQLDARLAGSDICIASDVDNPLCGPDGASAVFGPQKGATREQVERLDKALARYAEMVEQACREWPASVPGVDGGFARRPGAGAAGGLGFALQILGGRMASGAELIANTAGLPQALRGADWAITGEGRSDAQTLRGKLPVLVARMAREAGARPVLLSASLGDGWDLLRAEFVSLSAITPAPMTLAEALAETDTLLYRAAWSVARILEATSR
ncbi:glycerate kinase [Alicyclobacillus shizuokensis]|uniref:glycerate kinase n=1 Tax=Alicyclobacillus shizuokensis TaxID=392014 RepID=UPI00082D5964|nr:glycerate kinase [Alicyclobacillus shizuokensis]